MQGEYTTKEKNEIVSLCLAVYVEPRAGGTLNCSDFYALVYGATPPETWLHISWLGRCIHSYYRNLDTSTPSTDLPVQSTADNRNKKRAVSSKGKNMTILPDISFVDSVDVVNPSPQAKQLIDICRKHTIPFVDHIQHEQVNKAKETINLFYASVQNDVSVAKTFFSFLKSGLGYGEPGQVTGVQEELRTTVIAKWNEHNLIRVPKNVLHPSFVVSKQPDNSIHIEICTFHLTYTVEHCSGVLTLTFSPNLFCGHPESDTIAHYPKWKSTDNTDAYVEEMSAETELTGNFL